MQKRLSRPIVFLDITAYPDRLMGELIQGYHESLEGTEGIWLDSRLPYTTQEAIAAHELAHILQKIDAFPQAISINNAAGQPLVPALEKRLGQRKGSEGEEENEGEERPESPHPYLEVLRALMLVLQRQPQAVGNACEAGGSHD